MTLIAMAPKRKLRRWQCSLRSLLVVMTLTCLVLSVYAWRQARQRYLLRLVESFNVAMDEQRYADAEAFARVACKELPRHPVSKAMLEKSMFARSLGEELPEGMWICGTASSLGRSVSAESPASERIQSGLEPSCPK